MVSCRDGYLQEDDKKLLAQCEVHTYRAGGPGGQKRNKTDSAVRLKHVPTGLTAVGTESRSQHENKARALRRLRLAIALNVRDEIDLDAFTPPDLFAGCLGSDGRFAVGRRDIRYPGAAAVVMDVLAAAGGRMAAAAQVLGISTGSLNKFIENDPKVWEAVNRLRVRFGHERLKQ